MKNKKKALLTFIGMCLVELTYAQKGQGKQALTTATDEVKGYFSSATDLFYAVCAIMALIGAFKVYSKWSSGDPDTTKTAAGWFGGLIFAVIAVTVVGKVFGVE